MSQGHSEADRDLQDAITRELRWDGRIDAADVGVAVTDGVASLSGTVSSYAERIAAVEAAHRVPGVLDVADEIQVRPSGSKARTDVDIAKAVRQALEWDVLVPDLAIRSAVAQGWVTLEGEVNTWLQRIDAERAIRHLAGVRGVSNLITVAPQPIDTRLLKSEIQEALTRRAEREARRIRVHVDDGTVIVSGVVNSWSDRTAIVGLVGHAAGVQAVVDDLTVEPSL